MKLVLQRNRTAEPIFAAAKIGEPLQDIHTYENIRIEEDRAANDGLIAIVSDAVKTIRRLQADLAFYQVGWFNKVKEYEEMIPFLLRLPLARFLAEFEIEKRAQDDPLPANRPLLTSAVSGESSPSEEESDESEETVGAEDDR